MFGIKKLMHQWVIKRMSRELQAFIDSLKCMSPNDVSLIVMGATVVRNSFIKKSRIDFGNPVALLEKKPYIALNLGNLIKDCQRKNQFFHSAAYLVWMHTLRVASQPELYPLGVECWNELSRGIEYINSNPDLIAKCTSEYANPGGYDVIPKFV